MTGLGFEKHRCVLRRQLDEKPDRPGIGSRIDTYFHKAAFGKQNVKRMRMRTCGLRTPSAIRDGSR